MKVTVGERVVALETKMDGVQELLAAMNKKLDAIDKDLTKYRGAWGALSLVFAAIVTALTIFKDAILGALNR